MAESIEVQCKTGRTFTLRELNGLQSTNADKCAREPIAIISFRTAMAIRSIDGVEQSVATNDLELETRLQELTGRELRELIEKYAEAFALTDSDLGNGFVRGVSPQSS